MVGILSKLEDTQGDQFYFTTFMVDKPVAHNVGSGVDAKYDAVVFQCNRD